jgi:hypothetical protein
MPDQDPTLYLSESNTVKNAEDIAMALGKNTYEHYEYYRQKLDNRHKAAKKFWKLYLNSVADSRKQYEKWRALVHTPHHVSGLEVAIASASHLLVSGQPIRPEVVPGLSNQVYADKMGHWFDYILRMNHMRKEIELALRERAVQGLCIRKNIFIERKRYIDYVPSEKELEDFDLAIQDAIQAIGKPPPIPDQFQSQDEFLEAFENYRKIAVAAKIPMGEFPLPGQRPVVLYKGPAWKRVSYFTFFYDPLVPMGEQDTVIQLHFVPKQWILERTGKGPQYPFDPKLVDHWETLHATGRSTQEEEELQSIFGVQETISASPKYKETVRVMEAYHIGSKYPYRFVVDGQVAINKKYSVPFEHGDHPYTVFTGIELPFISSSLSDLYQVEPLIREMNTLRGLRIDGVQGSIMPVFAKLKAAGFGELANRFAPGLFLDQAGGPKAIQQISHIDFPEAAFRELNDIRGEIDESIGSVAVVRGSLAPPRTTAQGIERAQQNATIRQQLSVVRFEEDLDRTVQQWLSLAHQHYESDELEKMGGLISENPLMEFKREDFMQALNMRYAFRAASMAINREMQNQQLKDVFSVFVNAQVPKLKMDALAKKILKNIDEDSDDLWYTDEEWQQIQLEQQQAAAAQPAQPAQAQTVG